MQLVNAYNRPNSVRKVEHAVGVHGIDSMTILEGRGMGEQGGGRIDNIPRVKLEMVVPGEKVTVVVQATLEAAHTGQPGDGLVITHRLDGAWKIRTKEPYSIG